MLEDKLVRFAGFDFACVDKGFGHNQPVDVVIRPEDILIVGEDIGQISGTVESVLFKGVHYEMIIDVGDLEFKIHSTAMQEAGSRVGLNIIPYNIHIMRPIPPEEMEAVNRTEEGAEE
jgi:spermidine/putrescine transport system ATP-binding protein